MKKQKKNRIETALHLIASLRALISGTQTKCKENHKKCTCETKLPLSFLPFRQKLAKEVDEFITGGKLDGKFALGPAIMLMTVGDAFRMIKRVCDHVSLVAVLDGVNEINKTQELMQMMEQNEHHIPTLSDCNGCCYFGAGVRPEHCSGCYKFGNERPTKFVEAINFVSTDSNIGFTNGLVPYLTAPCL